MPRAWLYDLRAVWRLFLFSRLWVALFVYLGHMTFPYRQPIEGGWIGVDNWWLNPWTTYDSQWYLQIATQGYDAMTSAFQPLYPLLLRVAGTDEIILSIWGIVLSNLLFLGALTILHRLTRRDTNDTIALVAVGVLAFYPTAAVFSAVYSESLFAFLIFGMWFAARGQRWHWAAVCAGLAALTRNAGPVIAFALLIELITQIRAGQLPAHKKWFGVAAVLVPALCFVGLHLYYKARFGEMAGVNAYQYTFRSFTFPGVPVWRDFYDIVTGVSPDIVTILNFAVTLGVFALAWRYRKAQPVSYTVYMLCIMMMHLTYARYVPPYTNGSLRYMSTALPFVQILARATEALTKNRQRLILAAAGYLLICALFSFMFGQRQFSGG